MAGCMGVFCCPLLPTGGHSTVFSRDLSHSQDCPLVFASKWEKSRKETRLLGLKLTASSSRPRPPACRPLLQPPQTTHHSKVQNPALLRCQWNDLGFLSYLNGLYQQKDECFKRPGPHGSLQSWSVTFRMCSVDSYCLPKEKQSWGRQSWPPLFLHVHACKHTCWSQMNRSNVFTYWTLVLDDG